MLLQKQALAELKYLQRRVPPLEWLGQEGGPEEAAGAPGPPPLRLQDLGIYSRTFNANDEVIVWLESGTVIGPSSETSLEGMTVRVEV